MALEPHTAAVECDRANGSTHMYVCVTMVSLQQAWDARGGKRSFITVGNVRDMAHFRNAASCIFNGWEMCRLIFVTWRMSGYPCLACCLVKSYRPGFTDRA